MHGREGILIPLIMFLYCRISLLLKNGILRCQDDRTFIYFQICSISISYWIWCDDTLGNLFVSLFCVMLGRLSFHRIIYWLFFSQNLVIPSLSLFSPLTAYPWSFLSLLYNIDEIWNDRSEFYVTYTFINSMVKENQTLNLKTS